MSLLWPVGPTFPIEHQIGETPQSVESPTCLNYAIWESTAPFRAVLEHPEFRLGLPALGAVDFAAKAVIPARPRADGSSSGGLDDPSDRLVAWALIKSRDRCSDRRATRSAHPR
jgi:hypothetical protein